ncbi:hypothetical protein E8E13_010995 [Curvularia kusanoi]|uniref:Uncharacterized protein n=1 Tax=Curvularia kusanoi TaxID=90978 RepID=A0A9P4TKT2_CURKU|nr:hypothetical protein E8E13_010995 [Curvularia kusanoi]
MPAPKALEVFSDEASQRIALDKCSLVISPIREVGEPPSGKAHAMEGVHLAASAIASSTTIDTSANGLRHNLTLSRVTPTVDIPPLLPGQIDSKAMDQLSELLQSW